jgi:hypothetical protein
MESIIQCAEVGPFRLEMRQRGDDWQWSVYDSWFNEYLISSTASSLERAQEEAEEIVGLKPVWHAA